MTDFDQQVVSPDDQPRASSQFAAIAADNYALLLAVGVIVLVISLAYLASFWFRYYGGLAPKPAIGKVVDVSSRGIRIDIGSKQGLHPGRQLMAIRRGTFLADLSVQAVDPDGATVILLDAAGEPAQPHEAGEAPIVARNDTVIFSPLDRQP